VRSVVNRMFKQQRRRLVFASYSVSDDIIA
jgi:hypothetical protein